jgi:hypothetical protein
MKKVRTEVYAGIACSPHHPLADMHGLIRVVVMACGRHKALSLLKRAGITRCAFLSPSSSLIEHSAALLNRVVATDVRTMYLRPEYYREFTMEKRGNK